MRVISSKNFDKGLQSSLRKFVLQPENFSVCVRRITAKQYVNCANSYIALSLDLLIFKNIFWSIQALFLFSQIVMCLFIFGRIIKTTIRYSPNYNPYIPVIFFFSTASFYLLSKMEFHLSYLNLHQNTKCAFTLVFLWQFGLQKVICPMH